jgi:hypothetical protein
VAASLIARCQSLHSRTAEADSRSRPPASFATDARARTHAKVAILSKHSTRTLILCKKNVVPRKAGSEGDFESISPLFMYFSLRVNNREP